MTLSEGNHWKLKSLFVGLVRAMGAARGGSEGLEGFGQYLERLEGEKDEEGSRMTQI